jgi:hypothetical protein
LHDEKDSAALLSTASVALPTLPAIGFIVTNTWLELPQNDLRVALMDGELAPLMRRFEVLELPQNDLRVGGEQFAALRREHSPTSGGIVAIGEIVAHAACLLAAGLGGPKRKPADERLERGDE